MIWVPDDSNNDTAFVSCLNSTLIEVGRAYRTGAGDNFHKHMPMRSDRSAELLCMSRCVFTGNDSNCPNHARDG